MCVLVCAAGILDMLLTGPVAREGPLTLRSALNSQPLPGCYTNCFPLPRGSEPLNSPGRLAVFFQRHHLLQPGSAPLSVPLEPHRHSQAVLGGLTEVSVSPAQPFSYLFCSLPPYLPTCSLPASPRHALLPPQQGPAAGALFAPPYTS